MNEIQKTYEKMVYFTINEKSNLKKTLWKLLYTILLCHKLVISHCNHIIISFVGQINQIQIIISMYMYMLFCNYVCNTYTNRAEYIL